MARRRLTPTVAAASPAPEADVPRAEHSATLRPTLAAAAPIARVAGDAAGSAAFEEVSRALTQARETGRMVLDLPLDDIAPVAVFLASEGSRYLTGNTLFVDGGAHINGAYWVPDLD